MQRWINKPFVLLLMGIHLLPQSASADDATSRPEKEQLVIRDVELGAGGVATGIVLDAEGRPAAECVVELHKDKTVLQVTTDKEGLLKVEGLTGGPCVVKVGEAIYGCRFWANGTAPPNSLTAFAVVQQDGTVVRGQSRRSLVGMPDGWGHLNPFSGMTHKQLIAIGLLTAGATVAIVLAVQDDGDSSD